MWNKASFCNHKGQQTIKALKASGGELDTKTLAAKKSFANTYCLLCVSLTEEVWKPAY